MYMHISRTELNNVIMIISHCEKEILIHRFYRVTHGCNTRKLSRLWHVKYLSEIIAEHARDVIKELALPQGKKLADSSTIHARNTTSIRRGKMSRLRLARENRFLFRERTFFSFFVKTINIREKQTFRISSER